MLRNLTPHTMNLYSADKELVASIPPEPVPARCAVTRDKMAMLAGCLFTSRAMEM